MTGHVDTEHILDAFLAPEHDQLADRVLEASLADIARTPQRRALRVPWRFPLMPALTRATGLAAVALVAAVGVGGFYLVGFGGPGGTPAPSPVPTAAPSPSPTAAPTATPAPTAYVVGPLTQTFTSDVHGFTLMYPQGWSVKPATDPYTGNGAPGTFEWLLPTHDRIYDTAREASLFVYVISRPLDGASLEEWFAGFSRPECTFVAGDTIDGADRALRGECADGGNGDVALASSGGRGYLFELLVSTDDLQLRTLDGGALFDDIVATVQLRPENAVGK